MKYRTLIFLSLLSFFFFYLGCTLFKSGDDTEENTTTTEETTTEVSGQVEFPETAGTVASIKAKIDLSKYVVLVNGIETALNEDGTFTATVEKAVQYEIEVRLKGSKNAILKGFADADKEKGIKIDIQSTAYALTFDEYRKQKGKETVTFNTFEAFLPITNFEIKGLSEKIENALNSLSNLGSVNFNIEEDKEVKKQKNTARQEANKYAPEIIAICHIPPGNPEKRETIQIAATDWPAHSAHGDFLGQCYIGDAPTWPSTPPYAPQPPSIPTTTSTTSSTSTTTSSSTTPTTTNTTTTSTTTTTATSTSTTTGSQADIVVATWIDVAQGGCILFEFPNGNNMMYDCGNNTQGNDEVLPFLNGKGISRLNLVIISHNDRDHSGGFDKIVNGGITVDEVWINEIATETKIIVEKNISYKTPQQDELRSFGNAKLLVLNSGNVPDAHSDDNEDCIVIKVTHASVSFLITGDAADAEGKDLVNDYGSSLDSTVLNGPHHGSKIFHNELITKTSPEVTIFQSGNLYGHPTQEAIDASTNAGATIYRTDTQGDITVKSDGKEAVVSTQK
ncbi:ComEC/Rec2 family competence protein [Candidatus Riflebacteria bacterium]